MNLSTDFPEQTSQNPRKLTLFGGVLYTMPLGLKQQPNPMSRSSNLVLLLEPRTLMFNEPWGASADLIGQDFLETNFPAITGEGTVVAVIDTGIDYNHPALGGGFGPSNPNHKVIAGYDFVDNDNDPMDTFGHGTQVAGTIAADPFVAAGRRYQGIAPDAKLIALRIGSTTESVPLDRIKRALDWVLSNLDTYGIDAVNISFGFGRHNSAHTENQLGPELRQLAERNVIVTASSGNDGITAGPGIDYPAASSSVIAVGAVDEEGAIPSFTQRGELLTILAPGVDVPTTDRNLGYASATGTSFAAPMVAGAVALLKQISPDFTVQDIRSLLKSSSQIQRDGDNTPFVTTGLFFNRLDLARLIPAAAQRAPVAPEDAQLVNRGAASSTAFDSFGVQHVAYFDSIDNTLKYSTRNTAGDWSTPLQIDAVGATNNGAANVSLKIDNWGRPHVAYYDSVRGDLKYAFNEGDGFSVTTIDSAGNTGEMPAMVLSPTDSPVIAYYRRSSSELRIAEKSSGGAWQVSTVDSPGDVGKFPSITFDRIARLSLAYDDSSKDALKFAQRQPDGRWIRSIVDDRPKTGVAHTSIGYDANGKAYIAYQDSSPRDLKFAVSGRGKWFIYAPATVGDTGFNNQLVFDSGTPTVVSYDRTRNLVFRSRFANNVNSISTLRQNAGANLTLTQRATDGKFVGVFSDGSPRLTSELLL